MRDCHKNLWLSAFVDSAQFLKSKFESCADLPFIKEKNNAFT